MAQETNILIQVSSDNVTWSDLATIAANSTFYTDSAITLGSSKYYRLIAKGDGVNTNDSDPSASVNITNGFCTEYQAVIDYAENATPIVATPSLAQNIINDTICRLLVQIGKWVEFDFLYYFEQEAGTPYEFLTIDWKNPVDANRLINIGANPATFSGGLGFEVAGGIDQCFNTQFVPNTDAVKTQALNSGLIFKTFKIPATWANPLRIIGASGATAAQVNVNQTSGTTLLSRVFENRAAYNLTLAQLTGHVQLSTEDKKQKIFLKGSFLKEDSGAPITAQALTPNSLYLFGYNNAGSRIVSEGSFGLGYIGLGSSLVYNDRDIYQILNKNFLNAPVQKPGTTVLDVSVGGGVSVAYINVKKAVEFPTMNTTKKYVVFYSTDHNATGGCQWGEADTPDLQGFVERGVMVTGYSSEMPYVLHWDANPWGEPVLLFYHPNQTHPDSGGYQQTRLLTRASGDFHDQGGWTDRGKVLGITDFESANYNQIATGYLTVWVEVDNTLTGVHAVRGWETYNNPSATTINDVPKMGVSTSSDGGNWTRTNEDLIDQSIMPYKRQCHMSPPYYFKRNGIQYVACKSISYDFNYDVSQITVFQCDGSYKPTVLIANISTPNGGNKHTNVGFYIDEEMPDSLFIYYIANYTTIKSTVWNLKNLD